MPSGAKKDLFKGAGNLHDVNATFTNPRWEEREPTTGGKTKVLFVAEMQYADGSTAEQTWPVGPSEFLLDRETKEQRAYVENGQFLDVDANNPYRISANCECGMLFESLETQGISPTRMSKIGEDPSVIEGVTAHFVKTGMGRTYTATQGQRAGQTVEAYTFTVESIVEDPQADAKKPGGARKPATAAVTAKPAPAGRKPAPASDPEPEEEETAELTEAEEAAIAAVTNILSDPKQFVAGYSAKANADGITSQQMYLAGSKPGVFDKNLAKTVKTEASAYLRSKEFYTDDRFKGVYWNFDVKTGKVSQVE